MDFWIWCEGSHSQFLWLSSLLQPEVRGVFSVGLGSRDSGVKLGFSWGSGSGVNCDQGLKELLFLPELIKSGDTSLQLDNVLGQMKAAVNQMER